MNSVSQRLEVVRSAIADACLRASRSPKDVCLVAASKGQPSSAIRAAYDAGQRDFGENFAQELQQKASELADLLELRWHYIGRLQSNKANLLIRTAAVVHTVSSIGHLEALGKRHRRVAVRCLLQLRRGPDGSRPGAEADAIPAMVEAATHIKGVNVVGLMMVPPKEAIGDAIRDHFRFAHDLAASLGLDELSMGMSGDYSTAIGEGSTMVRVGSAIFGPRTTAEL